MKQCDRQGVPAPEPSVSSQLIGGVQPLAHTKYGTTRRAFLAASAAATAVLALARPSDPHTIQLEITDREVGAVPPDFIGLGYEISSVAAGVLSPKNFAYVRLVRMLGPRGVIRVGGNTSDYASFVPHGSAVSSPKETVITPANLHELGGFLEATGWSLIWGLNLGRGSAQEAVVEAQAVAAAAKDKLLAFEIGNEPDLFGHAHRPKRYNYTDYLREYRSYKTAIRHELPNAPFAGPDAANATDWVTRFASDEGNDLKLLTHHYYRECAGPASTLQKLLHPDPKLQPELEKLNAASAASHVPYRICETNSFCGGGKQGVSDTFGSALWALDFMFTLAFGGAAGVNIETGVNQLGWISWYSPIGNDERGNYSATPEYYGMLAFAQASKGQRLALNYDPLGLNLTAYAVAPDPQRLSLTIVNKEPSQSAGISISCRRKFARGNLLRLTGPSLESKQNVTLGGAQVDASVNWKASSIESAHMSGGRWHIRVPAASAAVLTLKL